MDWRTSNMNWNIKHDAKNQKFCTEIGGKECSLKYEKAGEGVLDYKMIFVPKNLRGQGIAGKLAEYGIAYAKKNGYKLKVTCSYVKHYINTHAEHKDLVVNQKEVA